MNNVVYGDFEWDEAKARRNIRVHGISFMEATSVWDDPTVLARVQTTLAGDPVFRSITGPLGTGGGSLTPTQLADLHRRVHPRVEFLLAQRFDHRQSSS